jgi:hypothetical protein
MPFTLMNKGCILTQNKTIWKLKVIAAGYLFQIVTKKNTDEIQTAKD